MQMNIQYRADNMSNLRGENWSGTPFSIGSTRSSFADYPAQQAIQTTDKS